MCDFKHDIDEHTLSKSIINFTKIDNNKLSTKSKHNMSIISRFIPDDIRWPILPDSESASRLRLLNRHRIVILIRGIDLPILPGAWVVQPYLHIILPIPVHNVPQLLHNVHPKIIRVHVII